MRWFTYCRELVSLILSNLPGHSGCNFDGERSPRVDLVRLCEHNGRASRGEDGSELHGGSTEFREIVLTAT
jgi:hypothetical protein